jgi:hypothetical protein
MTLKHTYLIFLASLCIHTGFTQDTVKTRSWELNGYVKDMGTVLFSNVDERWYVENLVHNRLNFKWDISKNFSCGAGMRNRFSFGNLIAEYPDYYISFGDDPGIVDLSWNIASGGSYVLNSSIDRLWIGYNTNKIQVTVGRQRINWGLNFV